jgi:hypothetical protein
MYILGDGVVIIIIAMIRGIRVNKRRGNSYITQPTLGFSSILSIIMTLLWVWGRIPIFQEAYDNQTKKIEDNEWLRVQCEDPRMRLHTDACNNLDQNQEEQSPIWVGFRAAACISCSLPLPNFQVQTWAVAALIFILLIPNVFLPMYRAYEDQKEHTRVMKACSPLLSSSGNYYYKNTEY